MIDVITCPHCQRRLALPPEHRDCDVQCPGCKNNFRVGAEAAPPPAPPPVVTVAPEPLAASAADDEPLPRRPSIARRPPPAPTWGGKAAALIIVGVAAVLGCCILLPSMLNWNRPAERFVFDGRPFVPPGDTVQIAAGVEEPQTARELEPLFKNLAGAFHRRDGVAIVRLFDTDRAIERLVEHRIITIPLEEARGREARKEALLHDLETGFGIWAPQLAWSSADILHIRKQNANDFAVVVRHRVVAENLNFHFRWWITRRHGAWRVYDMEDIGLGHCISALTGVAAEGRELAELQRLRAAIGKLREARAAVVVRSDANAAERALQGVDAVALPPHLDAIRWAVAALVPMERGQPRGVLDAVAKARAHKADLPVLDLFEGIGCNRIGQYEQAVPLLEAHNKLLGGDWETNRELGDALLGLGRRPEARAAYGRAFDENPQETNAFLGLLRATVPGEGNGEVEVRFRRFADPQRQFETLSEACRQRHDGAALERLALAMRSVDPNHAPAQFALALAKASAQDGDAAVAAFQRGIALERDAGKRNGQTTLFLTAMATAGLAVRAYAIAAEPRDAFHTLAGELKRLYRPDELRSSLPRHAPRDPADPFLPWYRGEVHLQRGQYALADKAFAAALAKGRDERMLDQFRASRVQARYYTGKAMDAYATIGPAGQTFAQLVALAQQDRDDRLIAQLIAVHAKTHADDPELLRQRLNLKIRQDDTAGATALFRAMLARKLPERDRAIAIDDFLYAMADAGKAVEAYAAAAELPKTFERLAGALRGPERVAELRQLIAAHRKRHADDPWLAVYTGTASSGNSSGPTPPAS